MANYTTSSGDMHFDLNWNHNHALATSLTHIFANKLLYTITITTIYIATCQLLRFRRARQIENRFYQNATNTSITPNHERRSLSTMTVDEAHLIFRDIMELEFPAMYEKGLQMALFRTYGIPSISSTLLATTQLCGSAAKVGKRYADTAVLISEIYENGVTSQRGIEAVARLNFLHGGYLRSGKIRNDDMLYTLALFMAHPLEWVRRTEWRALTEVERCAVGVWHLSVGLAMGIGFEVVSNGGDDENGEKKEWRDGVHFFEELEAWALEYEEKNMVLCEANVKIAQSTCDLMRTAVPQSMYGAVRMLISAAMDNRLRTAVGFEDPGTMLPAALNWFFTIRKWILRYLTLPRPSWSRQKYVVDQPTEDGRRFLSWYEATPHYVKPNFRNRYGFTALMRRLFGAPVPGDPLMEGQGFLTKECGPKAFLHKGQEEIAATQEKLRDESRRGCPVGIAR